MLLMMVVNIMMMWYMYINLNKIIDQFLVTPEPPYDVLWNQNSFLPSNPLTESIAGLSAHIENQNIPRTESPTYINHN
jgi:hypothetical protein